MFGQNHFGLQFHLQEHILNIMDMMMKNGKSIGAEKMQKLQELYEILVKEPKVKEYFDAEVQAVNKMIEQAKREAGLM